jgi:hypothetical protein
MQDCPYVEYPVLQVRPNTLLVYTRREWNPVVLESSKLKRTLEAKTKKRITPALSDLFRTSFQFEGVQPERADSKQGNSDAQSMKGNFKGRAAYSGKMSDHGRKRMKRAINLLIAAAQWKTAIDYKTQKEYRFLINFVTLTLPTPQGTRADKEIKKHVLDPWIKKAKRRFNLKSYVWRAEKQGNGNIHFHLCTDVFIPYQELRDTWNDNLEAMGFISEYEKKHKHRSPNSTDIHAVKNINNLAGYIVKYMSKDHVTQKELNAITAVRFAHGSSARLRAQKVLDKCLNLSEEPLDGKVWDCSSNLKIKGNCELFLEAEQEQIWNEERKTKAKQVIDKDRFSLICYNRSDFNRMLRGPIKSHWNNYLKVIRDHVPVERGKRVKETPPAPVEIEVPF